MVVVLPAAGLVVNETRPSGTRLAHRYGDVGVMVDASGCWNFVFPLEQFDEPKFQDHVRSAKPAYLVGRVVRGMSAIDWLGSTSKSERKHYSITLEAR